MKAASPAPTRHDRCRLHGALDGAEGVLSEARPTARVSSRRLGGASSPTWGWVGALCWGWLEPCVAHVQAALHLVEHVHVGAAQQAAAGALGLAALDDEVVVVADALLNHLVVVVSRAWFECDMMLSRWTGS